MPLNPFSSGSFRRISWRAFASQIAAAKSGKLTAELQTNCGCWAGETVQEELIARDKMKAKNFAIPADALDLVVSRQTVDVSDQYRAHLAQLLYAALCKVYAERAAYGHTEQLMALSGAIWEDMLQAHMLAEQLSGSDDPASAKTQRRDSNNTFAFSVVVTVLRGTGEPAYRGPRFDGATASAVPFMARWRAAAGSLNAFRGELVLHAGGGAAASATGMAKLQRVGQLFVFGLKTALQENSLEAALAAHLQGKGGPARRNTAGGGGDFVRKQLTHFFGSSPRKQAPRSTRGKSTAAAAGLLDRPWDDSRTFTRALLLATRAPFSFSPSVHANEAGPWILRHLAGREQQHQHRDVQPTPWERAVLSFPEITPRVVQARQAIDLLIAKYDPAANRVTDAPERFTLTHYRDFSLADFLREGNLAAAADQESFVLVGGARIAKFEIGQPHQRFADPRAAYLWTACPCHRFTEPTALGPVALQLGLGRFLERLVHGDGWDPLWADEHASCFAAEADGRRAMVGERTNALFLASAGKEIKITLADMELFHIEPARFPAKFDDEDGPETAGLTEPSETLGAFMAHVSDALRAGHEPLRANVERKFRELDGLQRRMQRRGVSGADAAAWMARECLKIDEWIRGWTGSAKGSWSPPTLLVAEEHESSPAAGSTPPLLIAAALESPVFKLLLSGSQRNSGTPVACAVESGKGALEAERDASSIFLRWAGGRHVRVYYPGEFQRLRAKLGLSPALRDAYTAGGHEAQNPLEDWDCFVHSLRDAAQWNPSGGKSQASFAVTADGRFVIKALPAQSSEKGSLLSLLPAYFAYLQTNELSLLSKIVGFYTVATQPDEELHYVVMQRVAVENETARFDLKGIPGRSATQAHSRQGLSRALSLLSKSDADTGAEKGTRPKQTTLWDAEWISQLHTMDFEARALPVLFHADVLPPIVANLARDAAFLASVNVTDYSALLVLGREAGVPTARIAIVDYACPYDLLKRLEHQGKSQLSKSTDMVTVQPPERYAARFVEGVTQGLVGVPGRWTRTELPLSDAEAADWFSRVR